MILIFNQNRKKFLCNTFYCLHENFLHQDTGREGIGVLNTTKGLAICTA